MPSITIGSDHAGYAMKELVKAHLLQRGYAVDDKGPFSEDSVDYPDFAHQVASDVEEGRFPLGILLCGSGNGVCMTANKHQGVRAALVWTAELAELARQHNNANVLCLPARFITEAEATAMVDAWLDAAFEGGRHERRVEKIPC